MQMMMFQYLHTVDADDGDLMIVQYSHTEDVDDDGLDDDVLTKPLSRVKFEHFRDKLGMVQKDLPERGSSDVAEGLYLPGTSVQK